MRLIWLLEVCRFMLSTIIIVSRSIPRLAPCNPCGIPSRMLSFPILSTYPPQNIMQVSPINSCVGNKICKRNEIGRRHVYICYTKPDDAILDLSVRDIVLSEAFDTILDVEITTLENATLILEK